MELKKNICFIINPISGVGKKKTIPPLIEKHLDQTKFNYQIEYTKYRGHGRELADSLKLKNDIIVAVGGDGSVNEIGSALIGSNCALAIIPCGSGNGLARHARIPLNHAKAIQYINKATLTKIDVGSVNNQYFLGTAGFGFDGFIAKRFDEFHKRGFLSYIKLVMNEYSKYKPNLFNITTDSLTFHKEALLCSVANSSQFGNGFTISPLSDLQDGKFEIIFLKPFKRRKILGIALRFFRKTIHKSSSFESFDFENELKIKTQNGELIYFHLDGEPFEKANEFVVKVHAKELMLLQNA